MNGKIMLWSCGRERKFRGENRRHSDRRIKSSQDNRFSYHKSLSKSTKKQLSACQISEEVFERWAEKHDDELDCGTTEVVIVDEEEGDLDHIYGLERKKKDWLYAKACECGSVTVGNNGRLEFHRTRRCQCRSRRQQMSA